jgi:hypothetical protein
MSKIKTPILDKSDFNERTSHMVSEKKISEQLECGMAISVTQNGYEISLVVDSKEKNCFIGKIIKLNALDEYEYKDLKVGDKIKFTKENITTAPYRIEDA